MLRLLARLIFWLLFDLGANDGEETQESDMRLCCRFILNQGNVRTARLAVERLASDPAFAFVIKCGGPEKAAALIGDLDETMHGAGLALEQAGQPENLTPLDARIANFFPPGSRPFANGNGQEEPQYPPTYPRY